MKIFLDTANMDEIRAGSRLGVISGVTTNPSLIAREGRDFIEVVREIASIVEGPVSAEAVRKDAAGIVDEAVELARIHPGVVVKIPVTGPGLEAVSELTRRGVRTNVTLVFSANQALLAALAGATYVSPFIGRIDDTGADGMRVLEETLEIFERYRFGTEVIAASIRHPLHVTQAALLGSHIATVPFGVLMQMLGHPLTDNGIAKFDADWAKVTKG
ncbi:MAG: fructose-6-phosphate aldolase [Peptococcaceae bacterium]|nr:fructose-6-phosphate aldolase [Peptococcaceae bacterium]